MSGSISEQSENYIDNSMNEYKHDASILYEEDETSTPTKRKSNKKKGYTKEDCIDEMRELNSKIRDKLKELNNRMERVLDNVKYKLILEHQAKQVDKQQTLDGKKKAAEFQAQTVKKQLELWEIERESLAAKIKEAGDYDQVLEVKDLIEKEKKNQEFLKKTIRELNKQSIEKTHVIERKTNSTSQFDNIMELTEK